MDIRVARQQNVARPQLIASALDDVVDVSGDEKENLVKRMLMKLNGRRRFVVAVMKFIIAFGHDLTRVKFFFDHFSQGSLTGFVSFAVTASVYSKIHHISSHIHRARKNTACYTYYSKIAA